MADKTLPDSESVRQLADRLRRRNGDGHRRVIQPVILFDEAADALDAQSARIKELEERLECNHAFQLIDGKMQRVEMQLGPDCDGIAARDATIKLQDQHIAEQSARITKLEEALTRLGSNEAFSYARAVDPKRDDELILRIDFARRALTEGK